MAFKMSGWSAFTKKDDKPISRKTKEGMREVAERVAKAGGKVAKKIMKKDKEKGVGRGLEPEAPITGKSDTGKSDTTRSKKTEAVDREKELKIVLPKKTISKVEKSEQEKKKEAMDKIIKGK